MILVAGIAKAAERKKQEEAAAAAGPAVKGVVVFGGNTRVLMQFSEDTLEVTTSSRSSTPPVPAWISVSRW